MEKILEVKNLRVRFPVFGGVFLRKIAEVKAVDGMSFDLLKGETLGLVGESGCGKSTVGRAIVNILRAMNYGVEISG
ncbi:MAG: ATP-binding cassette domain-containing protein, partial [Acidobacteriota bacterium]